MRAALVYAVHVSVVVECHHSCNQEALDAKPEVPRD